MSLRILLLKFIFGSFKKVNKMLPIKGNNKINKISQIIKYKQKQIDTFLILNLSFFLYIIYVLQKYNNIYK